LFLEEGLTTVKILFFNKGWDHDAQASSIMHGLRSLLGDNLIDYPLMGNLYSSSLPSDKDEQDRLRSTMYGRGFTYHFTLPDISIDRTDIERKIADRYFDAIIFGPCNNMIKLGEHNMRVFEFAAAHGNKVCVIDGDDLHETKYEVIHHDLLSVVSQTGGVYFKRELQSTPTKNLAPISLSFPKEKVTDFSPTKEKMFAFESSFEKGYKFTNEQDYYDEYRKSYYGKTSKRGGWDCLRHYEIIFNRSIPYFPDIDELPQNTMFRFPRELVKQGMKCINNNGTVNTSEYNQIEQQIFDYSMNNLTTISMAQYMIAKIFGD